MSDDLEAWRALVDVYQGVLHDVVRALETDAGIDSGMYSVLAYLQRAAPPGRLPLAELQRLMYPRYSQPGLSRLVQRMETAGLVERRANPHDGRATTLYATRAGRNRFARAHDTYSAAVHEHFLAHLEAGERARLASDLGRVVSRRDGPARRPRQDSNLRPRH